MVKKFTVIAPVLSRIRSRYSSAVMSPLACSLFVMLCCAFCWRVALLTRGTSFDALYPSFEISQPHFQIASSRRSFEP